MIHIIGQGPVGLLIASLVRDSGGLSIIVGKAHRTVSSLSFKRESFDGNATDYDLPYTYWDALEPQTITLAIICTKAVDAFEAYQSAYKYLTPEGRILFLNNGMGPQQAAQALTPDAVLFGSNTHGAFMQSENVLIHAGVGSLVVGATASQNPEIPLPVCFEWTSDINRVLWKKLGINALINPLAVLYQCKNGALLDLAPARSQFTLMAKEIDQIAAAEGIVNLQSEAAARDVAKSTAENWCSSMQDYRANKPTELPYITGYLLTRAKSKGIPCPHQTKVQKEIEKLHPLNNATAEPIGR